MKKVLIITYYWPPAGGPGVQRWLKFVKYLPEYNIEPIVYHPEKASYPIVDETLFTEAPKGIRYLKHPIKEPYKWAQLLSKKKTKTISSGLIADEKQSLIEKLLLWIRGNCFIPDARKNWVAPSVRYLKPILEKEAITTVITTGPPHSVHFIGKRLKEITGVRWLADFRDPWTSIGYHKKLKLTKSSQEKHKKLEQEILNAADQVIVTSSTTQKEFERITNQSIRIITNGYDITSGSSETLDEKFTLSHIGTLLNRRNPEALWAALKELVSENEPFREALKLQLIGVVSQEVQKSILEAGLGSYLTTIPYLTHDEAVGFMRRSQALLLIEINAQETQGIIPGKLFEYLAVERPILAVGPAHWDAAKILETTKVGAVFGYDDKEAIKKQLQRWFAMYNGDGLRAAGHGIERYSRRELTGQLAELIS